jgi:phage nucleotide-binding protein
VEKESLWHKARSVDETPSLVKMLLYGPPGVGKTQFCADAPNPIWIDFERSTETLRWIGRGDIKTVKPENRKEFLELIRTIYKTEYETLVIDSVSQQQDIFLADEMKEIEEKTKGKRSRYLPLYQEFRISTEEMKEGFRILQNIPINVVIIAHDRYMYKTDSDSGDQRLVRIIPDMTPRVNDAISRLINVIAYMDREVNNLKGGEVTRKLYVNSTGLIVAKNRLNIQQTFLANPSWKDLVK